MYTYYVNLLCTPAMHSYYVYLICTSTLYSFEIYVLSAPTMYVYWVLLCLWVAILVPAPSPLLSSFGPSWSSLEVPHVCTLCHCGLTMAILLSIWLTLLVFSGGPQWSYSMQVWCHLGNLAFSLSIIFCASSKSSCFFYCAILVFSGGRPCLCSCLLYTSDAADE